MSEGRPLTEGEKPRLSLVFPLIIFIFSLLASGVGFAETSVPNVFAKPGLDTSRKVEMTCGGTQVALICGYNEDFRQIDDRICSDNKLIFTLSDGNKILPHASDTLREEDYTPISIGCRHELGNPENFYIYTRYQNGSYNCMKESHGCNLEVIFTVEGTRVNPYKSDLHLDSHVNTISIEERNRD